MATFNQGMRMGAGLVGLSWGVYRMAQGQRDWLTTAALTTGVSMVAAGLTGKSTRVMMGDMMNTVSQAAPMLKGVVPRMGPARLANAGMAIMNAMR